MAARRRPVITEVLEVVQLWVSQAWAGEIVEQLTIKLRGRPEPIQLPFPYHLRAHTPPEASDGSCADDVLLVLREVGRKLTTGEVLDELESRDMVWGERTVKGVLADLVREGRLLNPPGERPRGYRLPDAGG